MNGRTGRRCAAVAILALAAAGAGKPLGPNSTVDDVLDAMHDRGHDLRSFTADVTQNVTDSQGYDTTRTGKAWFQVLPGDDARVHLLLDHKKVGERPPTKSVVEYLLDKGGVLTNRDYTSKTESSRQVVAPGQKLNLFELGKGPFPLPIGQDKAEVYKQFDVELKRAVPADDPPRTLHLLLTPKPGTPLAKQFKSVDVWVDVRQGMPVRVETVGPRGTPDQTTDLKNLQVNPPVKDGDFTLPPVAGWKVTDTIPFGQ